MKKILFIALLLATAINANSQTAKLPVLTDASL